MKQIKIEITLKEVEYWGLDWSDEDEKQRELDELTLDLTVQLRRAGILSKNIEVKAELVE